MTFLEAACEVLKSARTPLTTAEITSQALKRGLISTDGKTPVATMRAALYRAEGHKGVRRVLVPGRQRGSGRWVFTRNESSRRS